MKARRLSADKRRAARQSLHLFTCIMALALCGIRSVTAQAAELKVGDTAPLFTLSTSSGAPFHLAESLSHHPVLVAFVSMRCKPCEESLPAISRVRDLHTAEDSVEIACLMVSGAAALQNLTENGQFEDAAAWLTDAASTDGLTVADRFGVLGTPAFFLIGKDGTVLWKHYGPLTGEKVEQEIGKATRAMANAKTEAKGGS